MRFIALDPGKENVWGAKFIDNECHSLKIFDPEKIDRWERGDWPVAVCERPSIINSPNANDMAAVLWSGAIVASALSESVMAYAPSQWKGTMKKPPHHKRVIGQMTEYELNLLPDDMPAEVDAACKRLAKTGYVTHYNHFWHNYLDAIGLGMFYVGRIKRGGVKGFTNV